MSHSFQQRWSGVLACGAVAAFTTVIVGCGGRETVASKSADAYLDAKKRGVVVGADGHAGHGHPTTPGSTAIQSANTSAGDSMADMEHSDMTMPGGSMAGMDHSHMNMSHGSMAGMDHSNMNMSHDSMRGINHSQMNMSHGSMAGMDHSQMNMSHGSRAGMDHSQMNMSHGSMGGMNHSQTDVSQGSMAGMDHSQMDMSHGSMAGMDHSHMTQLIPPGGLWGPIDGAKTLHPDTLDTPAPSAMHEAEKSAAPMDHPEMQMNGAPAPQPTLPPAPPKPHDHHTTKRSGGR